MLSGGKASERAQAEATFGTWNSLLLVVGSLSSNPGSFPSNFVPLEEFLTLSCLPLSFSEKLK